MKTRNVFSISLLCAIAALTMLSCHKQSDSSTITIKDLTSKNYYFTNAKVWLIISDTGTQKILDIQRVNIDAATDKYVYESDKIIETLKYDVSLASLDVDGSSQHLHIETWRKVRAGKTISLHSGIQTGASLFHGQANAQITITGGPALYDIFIPGASHSSIIQSHEANGNTVVYSAVPAGVHGFMIIVRENEFGSPNMSYWHPINSSNTTGGLSDTIQWSAFTLDNNVNTIKFPASANWNYSLLGMHNQEIIGELSSLWWVDNNLKYISASYSVPPGETITDYMLFAQADHELGNGYALNLPVSDLLKLPEIPFKLKSFDTGNGGLVETNPEGEFDVLTLSMYGNTGNVSCAYTGASKDLKYYKLPGFPDSLIQQWPALTGFTSSYSDCTDFDGINGYEDWLYADRSSPFWANKHQMKTKWQSW